MLLSEYLSELTQIIQASLLIFRYDNAAHKPSLGFKEHKHVSDKILQSSVLGFTH